MKKVRVAFVCVHNSCRSQMAEAICRLRAGDVLEPYSAGTEIRDSVNPDAVAVVRELYGVDMTQSQKPKTLEDIPPVEIVVTMGCQVNCPWLPCRHREDWGLEDPSGKGRAAFVDTAALIEEKVLDLRERVLRGLVPRDPE
jgi:arsenate reductase